MIYFLKAYYPNTTTEPYTKRYAHLAEAINDSLTLMYSQKHTTIQVTTLDYLELIRLWGQPMPNGDMWP